MHDDCNSRSKHCVPLFAKFRTRFARLASIMLLTGLQSGCRLPDTEAPGALVPPTADQDARLPQLQVTVLGKTRALHLETFGVSSAPPLFVLPGGPGSDYRLLLPLRALSDRYFVVMWDPRGAGLSERVPARELTIDGFNAEISAVKAALAPGRSVTLIGHSFGGDVVARYTATHQDSVAQAVLVEPGPFTEEGRAHYHGGDLDYSTVEDFFWQNQILTSSDHAAADYKAATALADANRTFTCDGHIPEDPIWRFGVFAHHVLTHTGHAPGPQFDWAAGIRTFTKGILVVAGTCGAASEAFQREYNLPELRNARLTVVDGAGHMSLFTGYQDATIRAMKAFLTQYQKEAK